MAGLFFFQAKENGNEGVAVSDEGQTIEYASADCYLPTMSGTGMVSILCLKQNPLVVYIFSSPVPKAHR